MLKIIILSILIMFLVFSLFLIKLIRGRKNEFRTGCCGGIQGEGDNTNPGCGCASGLHS